jgi:hypothetical protein
MTETMNGQACFHEGCNHAAAINGLCVRHDRIVERFLSLERLLKRACNLAWKVHAKDLAEFLVARGYDSESARAGFVHDYFSDVEEYMRKLKPPQRPTCAECGADELYRSNGRYCSRKCRQKAYRKRVTAKASPRTAKRNERYASRAETEVQSVTQSHAEIAR